MEDTNVFLLRVFIAEKWWVLADVDHIDDDLALKFAPCFLRCGMSTISTDCDNLTPIYAITTCHSLLRNN